MTNEERLTNLRRELQNYRMTAPRIDGATVDNYKDQIKKLENLIINTAYLPQELKEGNMEVAKLQTAQSEQDLEISVSEIKKYIAPNATEKELYMFIEIAKSFKLNPFKREIHFVKYGDKSASIIVGYETYLKRAERTGKLDGWKCWIEKDEHGEKAVIEIKRKDQSEPFHWEVYRIEFDSKQASWNRMPTFMLKKVCIAQGFRLCFPEDLGGMPYIKEELENDDDDSSGKKGKSNKPLPTARKIANELMRLFDGDVEKCKEIMKLNTGKDRSDDLTPDDILKMEIVIKDVEDSRDKDVPDIC